MTDDREIYDADLTALKHERTRYIEAMVAGKVAIDALDRVRMALRTAADVSRTDDLVANFDATKTQIDHVRLAEKFAESALNQLWSFHEHLSDASLRIHLLYYVEEFSVAKLSLLGLFVPKNVQQVLAACGRTIAAVEATIAECERQRSDVELRIRTTIERRQSRPGLDEP